MPSSALTLVDWRRRVNEMYAEVRAETDHAAGHARWRETHELFATTPVEPTEPRLVDAGGDETITAPVEAGERL